MGAAELKDLIVYLIPIVVIQLGLQIFCIVNIARKGVRNLNKVMWIIIVVVFELLGAIAFLLFGKRGWDNDKGM
jgi:hypothetical protein